VGSEPTIPAFERAKTVHALDHAGTVIGRITVPERSDLRLEIRVQDPTYRFSSTLCQAVAPPPPKYLITTVLLSEFDQALDRLYFDKMLT
jgi:hypothetical protein